jgi:hypothetical protein
MSCFEVFFFRRMLSKIPPNAKDRNEFPSTPALSGRYDARRVTVATFSARGARAIAARRRGAAMSRRLSTKLG